MNMKRKQAVVMSAPRLEGDSIPSMATTEEGMGREGKSGCLGPRAPSGPADRGPAQVRLDEAPLALLSTGGDWVLAGVQRGAAVIICQQKKKSRQTDFSTAYNHYIIIWGVFSEKRDLIPV